MEVVTLLMILIYNNDFIIDDMMNLSIEIFFIDLLYIKIYQN